ncbi:MAG: hypothetical protein ABH859_00055 [Pseudomonadota bacterium]
MSNINQKNQASGRAVATLVLGILSISCLGIFSAIPATILGLQELKAIQAGQAPKEGDIITKIGLVLGITVIALTVMILLALITFTIMPHAINLNSDFTGISI